MCVYFEINFVPDKFSTRALPVPNAGSVMQESGAPPMSDSQAEARRARRRRSLDQLEIPEGQVTITDELLGKGGFGAVYLCDFNGRNAAAKVRKIWHCS